MMEMSKRSTQTTKKESEWRVIGILKAIVVAYAITAILFIGLALLLTYTSMPESSIRVIVIITTIISTLVAGYDTAKGAKSRGWFWGMCAGIAYGLVLVLINGIIIKDLALTGNTLTLFIMAGGGRSLRGNGRNQC